MDSIFNIKVDKTLQTPLYRQLGDAIFLLIENGVLKPNEKLPPPCGRSRR